MNIEKCYEKHKRLIFKISWNAHNRTGLDIEELISELNIVFCKAFQQYDVSMNVSFSNFLGLCCRNRIINMLRSIDRKKRKMIYFTDEELNILSHNPEESIIIFDNFVNNPNPIIREIAKIVSTYSLPTKNFRTWLKKELNKLNFKFEDINETFKTLQTIYDKR